MLREQPHRGASRLGKQGNKRICASDLGISDLLGVERGALIDALECRGGLGTPGLDHDVLEFVVEILREALSQSVKIGVAGAHHCGRVSIFDQRKQKVFERRILMVTPISVIERLPLRGRIICRGRALRHVKQRVDPLEPLQGSSVANSSYLSLIGNFIRVATVSAICPGSRVWSKNIQISGTRIPCAAV